MATNLYTNNTGKNVTGTRVGSKNALDIHMADTETTSFSELKVTTRYSQIEMKSAVDQVSTLRNYITATNGSVTVSTSGEYKVSTTAATSAIATFESGKRGRYIPGYTAECGVGIRIPSQTWTGNQYAEWGYFDEDNGLGYGIDANGRYVFIKRGGSYNKIYQSSWNKDTLLGDNSNDNPSGLALDYEDGIICQVEFVWYGYGAIRFIANVKDSTSIRGSIPVVVHVELPDNQTSIQQPNLPISVVVSNGTSSTAKDVYVGGRQFSIYGPRTEGYRVNGEINTTIAITNAAWVPLISFRRKSGIGNNQSVSLANLDIIPDANIIFTFVSGGTLTGASFGNLSTVAATETVVEVDTNASAITGGTFFGGMHVAVGNNQKQLLQTLDQLDFDFVNSNIVTLVAKSIGASANIEAVTLNVREQW